MELEVDSNFSVSKVANCFGSLKVRLLGAL